MKRCPTRSEGFTEATMMYCRNDGLGGARRAWIACLVSLVAASTALSGTVRLTDKEFGGIPNDDRNDGPALHRALAALIDQGGGTLEIPSGTYHIDQRVALEGDFDKLRIVGMGHGLSRLICRNEAGILRLEAKNADAVVEIADLDLPPGVPEAGTCLELVKPYSAPDDIDRNLFLSNLELKPEDMNSTYYTRVFELDGWKALVDNINTSGYYGPNFNTFEGKRKKYIAKSILRMRNAYQPRIRFSNFWAANEGVVIELTDAHAQPTISATVSVENAHGIHISKIGDNPLTHPVWIDGCHWNNAFTGLVLTGIDGFKLVQNCLYGAWDVEESYHDMKFVNCSNGDVVDNSFWFGVKPRATIHIDKDCRNIVVHNTHFGRGTSTEPVVIEEGAENITVRDNVYGTVYALDENDTFGLWEFEETGEGVAFDKDPLNPGRDNDLQLDGAVAASGADSLKLGDALHFNAPGSTATSTSPWPGAPGIRINLHARIAPGQEAAEATVLELPGVARLYLEEGFLRFRFNDAKDEEIVLEVPRVASRKDWFPVLAEVDPSLGRAVLEVGGSGGDRRFIEGVKLKRSQSPLQLAPVDGGEVKFRGALDQIWVQKL